MCKIYDFYKVALWNSDNEMRKKVFCLVLEEFMADSKKYKDILQQEDAVLSAVVASQAELRAAVNAKDWTNLMKVVSDINLEMDKFNRLDDERENFLKAGNGGFAAGSADFDRETNELLAKVRGKLVRCRSENKALGDFINITRNFVQKIIDTALPQSRTKVYGKGGGFIQKQPDSVVVNTLF